MKYTIKMMGGDKYEISEEIFKKIIDKSGLIYISELKCLINMSSVTSIVPNESISLDKIKLHDGGYAIKKHGSWVDENSGARIDPQYYAYVYKGLTHEEWENQILLSFNK